MDSQLAALLNCSENGLDTLEFNECDGANLLNFMADYFGDNVPMYNGKQFNIIH